MICFTSILLPVILAGCSTTPAEPTPTPAVLQTPNILTTKAPSSSTASSSEPAQPPSQTQAITDIREKLELPDLPLTFLGTGFMANAPSGDVEVAMFQDIEGRVFSVDPTTNRVIEIDARILLNKQTNALVLPQDELDAKALQYASALVPDFDTHQAALTFRGGAKADGIIFYDWVDQTEPGMLMPPRLQIGMDDHGLIFAVIFTLDIED